MFLEVSHLCPKMIGAPQYRPEVSTYKALLINYLFNKQETQTSHSNITALTAKLEIITEMMWANIKMIQNFWQNLLWQGKTLWMTSCKNSNKKEVI